MELRLSHISALNFASKHSPLKNKLNATIVTKIKKELDESKFNLLNISQFQDL